MHKTSVLRDYSVCTICGEKTQEKEWFIPFNYKAICRDCCKQLANLFWCKETEEALKNIEKLGKKSAEIKLEFERHITHAA